MATAFVPAQAHAGATASDSTSSTVLHSVWHATWAAATTSPLIGSLFVVSVAIVVVKLARSVVHGGYPKDPVRRFTNSQRALIITRAGGRCEYHSVISGRCPATERLEADHVHPWSRGGQTDIRNGQALCRRHNQAKWSNVPFAWQLRGLEARRAAYFPQGAAREIVRRATTPWPSSQSRTRVS